MKAFTSVPFPLIAVRLELACIPAPSRVEPSLPPVLPSPSYSEFPPGYYGFDVLLPMY